MGTFLTTPKMSPELAARVEASVSGKRPRTAPVQGVGKAARRSPGRVLLMRVLVAGAIVGLLAAAIVSRRRHTAEVDAERNALLAEVRPHSSQVTDADLARIAHIEQWVGAHAGVYEGDLVAETLRDAERRRATLGRPTVYLRGPLEDFTRSVGIAEMASSTFRDAFVLCLFDPPPKRSEKALIQSARAVLVGGERVNAAAHVHRFHTARAAMPVLSRQWENQVDGADTQAELKRLRGEVKRAPLADGVRALKSDLLLVAMDEAKDGKGPVEIDGAYRHYVRVLLLDLRSDEVLLRQRKLVDPSWTSLDARGTYASAINSCELALEVQAAMAGTPAPAVTP